MRVFSPVPNPVGGPAPCFNGERTNNQLLFQYITINIGSQQPYLLTFCRILLESHPKQDPPGAEALHFARPRWWYQERGLNLRAYYEIHAEVLTTEHCLMYNNIHIWHD